MVLGPRRGAGVDHRGVGALLDTHPVHAQLDKLTDQLTSSPPKVVDHVGPARGDLLAVTASPRAIWRQVWSDDPQERLIEESPASGRGPHRRRTDAVEITT